MMQEGNLRMRSWLKCLLFIATGLHMWDGMEVGWRNITIRSLLDLLLVEIAEIAEIEDSGISIANI